MNSLDLDIIKAGLPKKNKYIGILTNLMIK